MVDRAYKKAMAEKVAASPSARREREDALFWVHFDFPLHLGPLVLSLRPAAKSPARYSYDTPFGLCWWRVDHLVGPLWWRSEE